MMAPTTLPTEKELDALALRYRLVLPERQQASRIGELSGRRAGSSIEFQDRKHYTPGDDVRHIDWRAYARTDRLSVKMYREEICPTVDFVVDHSESMEVTPEKALRAAEVVHLLAMLARKLSARVRLYRLDDRLTQIHSPLDLLVSRPRKFENPLPLIAGTPASRGAGVKVLVSDLLFPAAPGDVLAAFPSADRIVVIQVLSAFEANPEGSGHVRLEDAETGRQLDLALSASVVRGYRERLQRWQEDLLRRLRVAGGALSITTDAETLPEMARGLLLSGVIAL